MTHVHAGAVSSTSIVMGSETHHHYSAVVPPSPIFGERKKLVCTACGSMDSTRWRGRKAGETLCDTCWEKREPAQSSSGATWEQKMETTLGKQGLILGPRQKEGYARGVFRPIKRR